MHQLLFMAMIAGTVTVGENEYPLSEPLCGG